MFFSPEINLPALVKDIPKDVSSYLLYQKSTYISERFLKMRLHISLTRNESTCIGKRGSSSCVFMFPSPEIYLLALAKYIPHVSSYLLHQKSTYILNMQLHVSLNTCLGERCSAACVFGSPSPEMADP